MKIYFCDKCNESIPLSDMQSNRITIDQGKIFCAKCAPKPVRFQSRFNAPTVMTGMLLCFALGMVAMAAFGDRILSLGEPREDLGTRISQLQKSVDQKNEDMGNRLGDFDQKLKETERRLGSRISEHAAPIRQLQNDMSGVRDDVKRQLEARARADSDQERRVKIQMDEAVRDLKTEVDDQFAKRRQAFNLLADKVNVMDGRMAGLESSGGGVGLGDARAMKNSSGDSKKIAPSGLDAKTRAALEQATEMLKSKEAPRRFQAVVDLGELRGRPVEEALVGALADETDYVRTTAINNLAEMSAKWTTPRIIRMLGDGNVFVREAAIAAIEKLTSRKVGLDPEAQSSKIQSKIRELEKWWKSNETKVLSKS